MIGCKYASGRLTLRLQRMLVVPVLGAALFMTVAAEPLGAQDAQPPGGSDPAAPLCMAFKNGSDAESVLVPATDRAAMQAKGFEVRLCAARFGSAAQRGRWRDQICGFAAFQSEPMQEQYERLFGERPAVLCAMAERVVGDWVRPVGTKGGAQQ